MPPINYGELLQYLYPDLDMVNDVVIRNDGSGQYIASWLTDDPAEPSQAELDAAWQNYLDTADERAAEAAAAEQDAIDAEANATGARGWYEANPNAALLFELTIAELEAEIDALDFSALPTGTANKLKLLLKTLSISVRVLAKRERLV